MGKFRRRTAGEPKSDGFAIGIGLSVGRDPRSCMLGGDGDSVELSGGAALVLGGRSLYLERDGARVPAAPLLYQEGRLRDAVEVAGTKFDVPRGSGGDAMALIAASRWRGDRALPASGPYLEPWTELEGAFLQTWLAPDEFLLAFLETATDLEVVSEYGPKHSVQSRFVWTDRRAAWFALGPLGDLVLHELASMSVQVRTGRDIVTAVAKSEGAEPCTWHATLGNEDRYGALAPHLSAPSNSRLRFVVDACRAAHRDEGERLLASLDGPRARVERALLSPDAPEPLSIDDAFVASLTPEAIVAWADAWKFDAAQRLAIFEALRAFDAASPHALALSDAEWSRARSDDPVAADLKRADDLRGAGDDVAAKNLLESSLAALPDPDLADLVPHTSEDGNLAATHVRARIALLEALAPLDPTAPHALARLEPMVPARIEAIQTQDVLADRAGRLLAVLEHGLPRGAEDGRFDRGVWSPKELEALRHPIGRTDAFAATVQSLVATVQTPDHSALRTFCAKLDEPTALASFEVARTALGVDAQCYVSRGELATGCRAYDDGAGAFVVLGGRHLDEGPLKLSASELRYALGSELAHLRFGHARVTSSEMWRGAVDKGLSGFEMLFTALPLMKSIRVPDSFGTVLGAVRDGTVGKWMDKASGWFGKKTPADEAAPEEKESMVEPLLATHRLMQLTADRVGLALAGDLGAVRAMLALRGEKDVAGAEEMGLEAWATRRKDGVLVDADLAVRLTAMLSFYLSADWPTLTGS